MKTTTFHKNDMILLMERVFGYRWINHIIGPLLRTACFPPSVPVYGSPGIVWGGISGAELIPYVYIFILAVALWISIH